MALCRGEWISFINIMFVFVGIVFVAFQNDNQFPLIHDRIRTVNPFIPSRALSYWIWVLLYILLVAAVFLFFLHDDLCVCRLPSGLVLNGFSNLQELQGGTADASLVCAEPNINAGLQTAAWIFIIVNITLLNLRNLIISRLSPLRAALLFTQSLLATLTSMVSAVLLFAAAQQTNSIVYLSASVYVVLSVWLIFVTLMLYENMSKFDAYAQFDKDRGAAWFARSLRVVKR